MLTTLPVIIYFFRRVSLVSFIANPVILPVQPLVMILGGIAVLLGLVYLPLGKLVAYLAWPFVVYTIRVVEWFANLPGGVLVLGSVTLVWIALFYILLFGWTFAGPRLRGWFSARVNLEGNDQVMPSALFGALLVALAVLAILVWREALTLPDGRLHLTVLDVGSGDALLIRSPSGGYALVDGGESASRLSDALGRRLPLTHRRLDYLVVAAPGEDNLAALPAVLERFPAEHVLWAGPTHGSRAARDLREHLAQNGFGLIRAETGQVLELGEGARLIILAAGERGAVLLLEWDKFQALLPLGIDFESLERLQDDREPGQVTVLLLAESGYAPANPPEWIRDLNPQVILLSVAAGDWQGLPSPETLQAIQGYTLLRTDRNGWIQLSTDGEQLWLEVERN
jgi:competence protein ComEC